MTTNRRQFLSTSLLGGAALAHWPSLAEAAAQPKLTVSDEMIELVTRSMARAASYPDGKMPIHELPVLSQSLRLTAIKSRRSGLDAAVQKQAKEQLSMGGVQMFLGRSQDTLASYERQARRLYGLRVSPKARSKMDQMRAFSTQSPDVALRRMAGGRKGDRLSDHMLEQASWLDEAFELASAAAAGLKNAQDQQDPVRRWRCETLERIEHIYDAITITVCIPTLIPGGQWAVPFCITSTVWLLVTKVAMITYCDWGLIMDKRSNQTPKVVVKA